MKNQNTLVPASLGTVSHGTLRTIDLLDRFASELEGLALLSGDFLSRPENFPLRDQIANAIGEAQDCFAANGDDINPDKEETAEWLVNETLPDLLNLFAPEGAYFGAHAGDGSDFGFWPAVAE